MAVLKSLYNLLSASLIICTFSGAFFKKKNCLYSKDSNNAGLWMPAFVLLRHLQHKDSTVFSQLWCAALHCGEKQKPRTMLSTPVWEAMEVKNHNIKAFNNEHVSTLITTHSVYSKWCVADMIRGRRIYEIGLFVRQVFTPSLSCKWRVACEIVEWLLLPVNERLSHSDAVQ